MATNQHNTITGVSSPGSGDDAATSAGRKHPAVIQIPRAAVWILAAAIITPWIWLAISLRDTGQGPVQNSVHSTPRRPGVYGHTVRCKPGPWGDLEYTRIVIEPPDEFILADSEPPREIRWFFKGWSKEAVQQLWQSVGQSPPGDPATWETSADGTTIRPTKGFFLSVKGEVRARIYTTLSAWVENAPQNEPFRFRAEAAEEWFSESGLSDRTISLVKQTLYRRGTSLCFSDEDLVLPMLDSADERKLLCKTLARKSTLLLKLRINPSSDINALADYWGKGYRSKDVKPLLKSLTLHPEGVKLDVAHLLPRNARMLLYTYPFPPSNPAASARDCHWTALNFLNLEVDDRFLNPEVIRTTLESDYFMVPGERTFGDLLLFFRPDGSHAHTCVYIADDIVFTKNGASYAMPWILMTLADAQAFYPSEPPMEVVAYRSKRG